MSFVEVCIMHRAKQQPPLTIILIAVKKRFDTFYGFLKIMSYFQPVFLRFGGTRLQHFLIRRDLKGTVQNFGALKLLGFNLTASWKDGLAKFKLLFIE